MTTPVLAAGGGLGTEAWLQTQLAAAGLVPRAVYTAAPDTQLWPLREAAEAVRKACTDHTVALAKLSRAASAEVLRQRDGAAPLTDLTASAQLTDTLAHVLREQRTAFTSHLRHLPAHPVQ